MKRNISVNIFGTLYPIDEDAYELLQKYNENMRRYYSRREGGDEIADDIEHRVAELLSDLRSQGVMAITIEHVKEIIDRIGDPWAMDDGDNGENTTNTSDSSNSTAQEGGNNSPNSDNAAMGNSYAGRTADPLAEDPYYSKKLFRDPEDKLLGGVLSGLSHYFGIKETIVLRLLMIILLLISFTLVALIYVIAWILIPEAITPEDRLRMYGRPVSARTINEELMRGVNATNNFVTNPHNQDSARGCLSAIMKFVLFCVGAFFVFIFGSIFLAFIAALAGISVASITSGLGVFNPFDFELSSVINAVPLWLVLLAIASILIVLGLPLFGLIKLLSPNSENNRPMSTTTKALLIIGWVIFVGILIGSVVRIAKTGEIKYNEIEKSMNTRNGIYLSRYNWNLLDRTGWTVDKFEGISRHIDAWGTMPDGESAEYLKLEAKKNPHKMVYNLSQKQELGPGTYIIEGDIKAHGTGNALYVLTNNGKDTVIVDIPRYEEPTNEISDQEVVMDSNDFKKKWTHVEGEFQVTKRENVKYGISNQSELRNAPWNGEKVEIGRVRISQK